MSFTSLRLTNVRCFKEATLPLDPRASILIGENGAGKTTLAEALASLCYQEEHEQEEYFEGLTAFPLRRGETQGKIELFSDKQRVASWSHSAKKDQRQRLESEQYLFAYGRYRRVQMPVSRPRIGGPQGLELLGPEWDEASQAPILSDLARAIYKQRTTTLTRPGSQLLRGLRLYLVEIHDHFRHDPKFPVSWACLNESIQILGLQGIKIIEREERAVPVLLRGGLELELEELSDGYQTLLTIVFDLCLRYLFLFKDLENPLSGHATVIVDEVDLHLHPKWQRSAVSFLTTLFPGTQWIFTTHSGAVVQGAIDEGYPIFSLVEKDGASQIESHDSKSLEYLKEASLESVLMTLFHLMSRYSTKVEEEIERPIRELREKVEQGVATAAERKALLGLLQKMQSLYAEEEVRRSEGALFSELAKTQLAMLHKLESLIVKAENDGQGQDKASTTPRVGKKTSK